jgi:hypothetical protein
MNDPSAPRYTIPTVLTLLAGIILGTVAAAAVLLIFAELLFALERRHDRRRKKHQGMTDAEVAEALGTFGADISVWPSRAPKNGSAHE